MGSLTPHLKSLLIFKFSDLVTIQSIHSCAIFMEDDHLKGIKAEVTQRCIDARQTLIDVENLYQPEANDDEKELLKIGKQKLIDSLKAIVEGGEAAKLKLREHQHLSYSDEILYANEKEMEQHLMETNQFEGIRDSILSLIGKIQKLDEDNSTSLPAPVDNGGTSSTAAAPAATTTIPADVYNNQGRSVGPRDGNLSIEHAKNPVAPSFHARVASGNESCTDFSMTNQAEKVQHLHDAGAPANYCRSSFRANNPENYQPNTIKFSANELLAVLQVIKPFNGETCDYPLFISSFDFLVHENNNFSPIIKQSILLRLLEGDVFETMRPAEMSEEEYKILRQNLDRQFNTSKIQQSLLIDRIKDMVISDVDNDVMERDLNTYCNITHRLRVLGININDPYFLSCFVDRLPEAIRSKVNRKLMRGVTNFEALSNIAYEMVADKKNTDRLNKRLAKNTPDQTRIEDESRSWNQEHRGYQHGSNNVFNEEYSRSTEERRSCDIFKPPSRKTPCVYCDSSYHDACQCTMRVEKKIEAVIKKKLCENCLSKEHNFRQCKSRFRCAHCNYRHFSGHCNKVDAQDVNNFLLKYDLYDDDALAMQLFREKGAETSN